MAAITVPNTFSNGTAADATAVNANFDAITDGLSDGTKDITVSAATINGALTANGAVTLGNATADDIIVTGRVAADFDPKTASTYDMGDATQLWKGVYANDAFLDRGAVGTPSHSFHADTDTGMWSSGANVLDFAVNGSNRLTLTTTTAAFTGALTTAGGSFDGAVVINESGADVDTRIEGDTDTDLFFVDASTNRIGISTNTPDVLFHIDGDTIIGSDGVANASLTCTTGGTTSSYFAAVFRNGTNAVIMELRGDNKVVINGLTSTDPLATDANGVLIAGASDSRLKSGVKDYDLGLKELRQVRAVTHRWKEGSDMDDGGLEHPAFIADDIKKIEPRIVGEKDQLGLKDCLTFTGKDLMPMAVNSIQELADQLEAALLRIESLEN